LTAITSVLNSTSFMMGVNSLTSCQSKCQTSQTEQNNEDKFNSEVSQYRRSTANLTTPKKKILFDIPYPFDLKKRSKFLIHCCTHDLSALVLILFERYLDNVYLLRIDNPDLQSSKSPCNSKLNENVRLKQM
jgi:hypothetical protein